MEVIEKYFSSLTEKQSKQFSSLMRLYKDWNSKINVISRKDIDSLYTKHVLHSLAISRVIQFTNGTNVLDVGTGGGFPGIPLAILFPEVNFILIDSVGKKIKVVNEISIAIGLKNVTAIHNRVENIKTSIDFVVCRAVTNMTDFKKMVKGRFSKTKNNTLNNGILYLKGGDLHEELKGIAYDEYNISDFFNEEFFCTKKVIYIGY